MRVLDHVGRRRKENSRFWKQMPQLKATTDLLQRQNKKVKTCLRKIRISYNENNNIFEGQGNPLSPNFEGLPTGYLWAKLYIAITNK